MAIRIYCCMVVQQADMTYPLILSGKEQVRTTFVGASNFYPGYTYQIACAGPLDIASAIGAAHQAERGTAAQRKDLLQNAANEFKYSQDDLEHAVRMTGMPIKLISSLFAEIPEILKKVPDQILSRFNQSGLDKTYLVEKVSPDLYKVLIPNSGFCYAITPGNDPRATALVAANLTCLGIPFIIRASIRDAAAPLVIRALNASGIDPRFAQLLYLDREDPYASQNHAHLVEACSIVWTFGPPAIIDRTLRFQPNPPRASLDLEGVGINPADMNALHALFVEWGPSGLDRRIQVETSLVDLFAGKSVLRHASGNCAALVSDLFTEETQNWLYVSIGYAIVCTATKSMMVVGGNNWVEQAAGFLDSLVVGDPLDSETQVGYIDSNCLDFLGDLRKKNQHKATFFGGQRISQFQAAPLLVHSQADLPDFFAQEIPAYVLACRYCQDLNEGIRQINHYTHEQPRLAVSLMDFPLNQLQEDISALCTQTILVNQPTTILLYAFHEGNDYALLLSQGKLVAF
jgi:acyl-CoA reductase-like NAD-dependent aldehyde dehydrogenase